MKQIFIAFILMTASIFAQNWIPQGSGYTYSFDLKYTNEAVSSDSVAMLDFNMDYGNLAEVFIEGNSNSPVDTIVFRSGGKIYGNTTLAVSDTSWGSDTPLKDSTGTIINIIVNQSTGKHFFIYEPLLDLIEARLTNYRAEDPTRSVTITIKTKKSQTQ